MTLQSTQLNVAVQVANRALRLQPEATVDERLAAFKASYALVAKLKGGTGEDEWTQAVLGAAWDLAEPAFAKGGRLADVLAALEAAHRAVVQTAAPPPKSRRVGA